jgi:hypothetical protein
VSACHGRPFEATEDIFWDMLLFSKLWGTREIAAAMCKTISGRLDFAPLMRLIRCVVDVDMPYDAMEDRARLFASGNLTDPGLVRLPLPVLARMLDVPWKDADIDPLLAFLVGQWNTLGHKNAPLFAALELVELTKAQFDRLTAAGVDLLFCPILKANDLFKQKRFVEGAQRDCEVLRTQRLITP